MGNAAADPQQTPGSPSFLPPPGTSRGARPLLSPTFSRKAFPPAVSASASAPSPAAVVSEPRSVSLDEWWLARVEGHGKFGVAGFFQRNGVVREFVAEPISKRYAPCTVETDNGTVLFLHGSFNTERALQNGYTTMACDKFCLGFPHWWDKWNLLYPMMMSSQTGSQPNSYTISNSREDNNLPSSSMLECTDEESNVTTENTSFINKGCQNTPVASFKSRGCMKKPQCIAVHEKAVPGEATYEQSLEKGKNPVGPSRNQLSPSIKLPHASRSPKPNIQCLSLIPYHLTRNLSKSSNAYSPEYLNLSKTKSGRVVVPALDSGCQNIIYDQDGSITAIVGLDLQSPVKGSHSRDYANKKRKD